MKTEEKALARVFFENKIHKLNGSAFEDLFTQIMNYAEPEFEQIKAWGNIGDRKNDGFIRSKGMFLHLKILTKVTLMQLLNLKRILPD